MGWEILREKEIKNIKVIKETARIASRDETQIVGNF
jgi:hypothetical protein